MIIFSISEGAGNNRALCLPVTQHLPCDIRCAYVYTQIVYHIVFKFEGLMGSGTLSAWKLNPSDLLSMCFLVSYMYKLNFYQNCKIYFLQNDSCIFTRGQFWNLGIVIAHVCLVPAITHHPFKLEPPNLDIRWKYLSSCCIDGSLTLTYRFNSKIQFPHYYQFLHYGKLAITRESVYLPW